MGIKHLIIADFSNKVEMY